MGAAPLPYFAWREELKSIDVNALSPLEALTKLYELKKKAMT